MKRVVAPLVLLPLLHGVAASQPAGVPDHTVPPGANYDKAEFRLNKGGIYYSALVPRAARAVPALLFVGDKDPAFRTSTIAGLFAVNRRAAPSGPSSPSRTRPTRWAARATWVRCSSPT